MRDFYIKKIIRRSSQHRIIASAILLSAAFLLVSQVALPTKVRAELNSPIQSEGDSVNTNSTNSMVFVPSLGKTVCWATQEPHLYGVQMYGKTGEDSEFYDEMLDLDLDWIRVPVKWSQAETKEHNPPVYDWSYADAAVQAALEDQGCKRIILTYQSAPDWAVTFFAESALKAEKLTSFAYFLTALAERYDGDGIDDAAGSPVVNYFELYNEPDSSVLNYGHSGWGDPFGDTLNHQEYVDMLSVAYPAIKAANPKAQVLLGGVAHDWFAANVEHPDRDGMFVEDFLFDVLELGAGKYFDIFNVHVYPSFGETWIPQVDPECTLTNSCTGPGLLEKVAVMRNLLAAHNLEDKPIFITESGWYSDADSAIQSNETIHARYVVELAVQAKASDVDVMILFSLVDPDLTLHKYGLIASNGRKKLGYGAYAEVVQRMSEATFIRKLSDGETTDPFMEAYVFVDHSTEQTFLVAWRDPANMGEDLNSDSLPDTNFVTKPLTLTGNEAQVYDMYGEPTTYLVGSQGVLSIDVGPDPVYIVLTK